MSSLNKKLLTVIATASLLIIGGCGSTQTSVSSVGPSMVGPGAGQALGSSSNSYSYNSSIYMDVAIPVSYTHLTLPTIYSV